MSEADILKEIRAIISMWSEGLITEQEAMYRIYELVKS